MMAGATSHWWSVREFLAHREMLVPRPAVQEILPAPMPMPAKPVAKPIVAEPVAARPAGKSQKDFYETLLERLEHLQNRNTDLEDQLAETNRTMMNLELRVDSHSKEFRPMPTTEDHAIMQDRASIDDPPGVLPPRADPVLDLPTFE